MAHHVFVTGEIGVGKSTAVIRSVSMLDVNPAGFRTEWRTENPTVESVEGRPGATEESVICHTPVKGATNCTSPCHALTERLYMMPYASDSPAFAFAERSSGFARNEIGKGCDRNGDGYLCHVTSFRVSASSVTPAPPRTPVFFRTPAPFKTPTPFRAPVPFRAYPEILDMEGPVMLMNDIEQASLIVMDELGFIESEAAAFRAAITSVLDGDIAVLGVLRGSSTPFLDSIRAREDVDVIEVTRENRDAIPDQIYSILGR